MTRYVLDHLIVYTLILTMSDPMYSLKGFVLYTVLTVQCDVNILYIQSATYDYSYCPLNKAITRVTFI